MSPHIATKRKRVAYWTILFALSIGFTAVTAEGFLRFMGYRGAPESLTNYIRPVDDPVLNWRYIPHSKIQIGDVDLTYNSAGFRDIEHVRMNSNGKKRIIVLGDSVTEGWGVRWESVFAAQIQRGLGEGYEVINLAMSGLNCPQEVHLLEAEDYEPDLVVLNFILNDSDFYSEFHARRRYLEKKDSTIDILNLPINPELKRVLRSSALIYFVKDRIEKVKDTVTGQNKPDYFTALWERSDSRLKVQDAFNQLAGLQRDKHFSVLILIWPVLTDFSRYPYRSIHDWILQQAEYRSFAAIDLLNEFSKYSFRTLQRAAEDNIHPNKLGHDVASKVFMQWHSSHREI